MTVQCVDGELLPGSVATYSHQEAVFALAALLRRACPDRWRVVLGPFRVKLGARTELYPDIVVADYVDVISDGLTGLPVLVVEVVSPGSGPADWTVKQRAYARAGVPDYWIVDPDELTLSVFQLDSAGGVYLPHADVAGDQTYRSVRPFPVQVMPGQLLPGVDPHPATSVRVEG